jgi:hypothetical protein
MNITYRTKRRLQRAALIGATVLLLLILVGFCWVIWLERYVVYTRDGATLNFDVVEMPGAGQLAMPPSAGETVPIYVNEGLDAIDLNQELSQISGYYIDTEMLQTDVTGARDIIATVPPTPPSWWKSRPSGDSSIIPLRCPMLPFPAVWT